MKRNQLFIFIAILICSWCFTEVSAQSLTQTIRGKVIDKQSKSPLPGATIQLMGVEPIQGTLADEEGNFRLSQVPVGRRTLKVRYVGYNEQIISDLVIGSAKEVIVTIELEESLVQTEEVVVTADTEKDKANNELAFISARTFNIDETRRYAGNRNDPARMAANFAGVSGADDARNDIIIRGNSPIGLLWRLEGIAIPNPNHFSGLGTTGGPVSILNNNLLTSSDFFTSAFPAEYGNATSGVFDLKMRPGNNEQHEFTGQVGFNGFEAMAEGPINKNKGSSYLASYRYSTLEVFQAVGISFGTAALPKYQDFSFKLNFPNTKAGSFSVFGIGGVSTVELLDKDQSSEDIYGGNGLNIYFGSRMGTAGLNHIYFFNNKTYSHFTLSVSREDNLNDVDSTDISIPKADRVGTPWLRDRTINYRYTASGFVNHKFNARISWKTGLIGDVFDLDMSSKIQDQNQWRIRRDFEGNTGMMQAYSQILYRFNEKLSATAGLHYQQLFLNQSAGLGPRVAFSWKIHSRHQFNAGYGLHFQNQPMALYFFQTRLPDMTQIQTNRNIGLTRSQHWVAGYDIRLGKNIRFKWENYFQQLSKVPVEQRLSSFSSLNLGADFVLPDVDSLVNAGSGYNYGTEFTLEKFFSHQFYFLTTLSIYESKYKGSDQVERNTAFNNRHVFNALGGKEFKIGKKGNSVITTDIKCTWAGGRRYTPIDTLASRLYGETKRDFQQEWAYQFPNYFRLDFKMGYRINRPKTSQHFFIDIQNITNRRNYFSQSYDNTRREIVTTYQLGLFPVFNYRIEF
jgi:hypothetical protein